MLRLPRLLLTSLLVGLVLLLSPQTAIAQEPECPDGFHWERLSGVGCVQTDCMDIDNAHYSYTKSCICNDGFQACYEPIDVTGINCGPNCPFSILVACVPPESACPDELPAATEIEDPAGTDNEVPSNATVDPESNQAQPDEDAGLTEAQPPMLLPEQQADAPPQEVDIIIDPDLAGLVQELTEFLAGEGITSPTPGQAAGAGTALATLLGSWVLIQMLSGVPTETALRAVDQWRRGAAIGPQQPETAAPALQKTATIPPPGPAQTDVASGPAPGPRPGADAGISGTKAADVAAELSPDNNSKDKKPWSGKTHHFEMRVVDTVEVGGFGAAMTMAVDIRAIYKDETGAKVRSAPVRYRFVGGGVTFGLTAKSGNFGGDWEYFRTINPVGLNAFEGVGSYKNKGTFALGIGATGPTEIWFQDTSTRVRPKSKFTKGIGASYWSAYVGWWKRM